MLNESLYCYMIINFLKIELIKESCVGPAVTARIN